MNNQFTTVWDPIVRLFHWSLLGGYSVAYLTQDQGYELHLQSGYFILTILIIRILWGFFGTRHALFRDFVYAPKVTINYLNSIFAKKTLYYQGHNPAGGLMVLFIIVSLLTVGISGIILDAAENRSGPLGNTQLFLYTDSINSLHIYSTYISIGLIALHISGVLFTSYLYKENLALSMITGKKRVR